LLDRPTGITHEVAEALGTSDHHVSGRSTANAFTHPPTATEIAGLGRKTLLLAGVLTEAMIQHTGLFGRGPRLGRPSRYRRAWRALTQNGRGRAPTTCRVGSDRYFVSVDRRAADGRSHPRLESWLSSRRRPTS
jgi:hypothetical protein